MSSHADPYTDAPVIDFFAGGWSRELPRVYGATQEEQIDQTFKNVTHALQETGAAPEHIFRTVIYHRPMSQSALDAVIRNLKELAPNHEPLWTAIEVTRLAVDEMLIEMDVQAHVPSKV